MFHTVLIASATFFFILFNHYVLHPAFFSPLAGLPAAHPLAKVTKLWHWWQQRNSREIRSLLAAHRTKGPIVRLSPNEVSVASLEGLRQVYTPGLEKDPWYFQEFSAFGTANLVSMIQNGPHSVQKRVISNVYSKSYIQSSADVAKVSTTIIFDRFLPLLHELSRDGRRVNMMEMAQWAGMDMMTAYLFGVQNGTKFLQDKTSRDAYFGNFICSRDITDDIKLRMEEKCMSLCQATREHSRSDQHHDTDSTPVVFLRLYEHLSTNNADNPLTQTAAEMFDHILASHETTGITLTYTLYRLSLDPDLQTQLRAELRTLHPPVTRDSTLKLPSPSSIDSLPLLHAIMYETLRLHAPTSTRLPRIVSKGGILLHGFHIPAGTTISSNAYTLHRNEDIFPHSDQWIPARWIPTSTNSEQLIAMRKWFWAFGSGGRMCIGSNFSIQILKLLVTSIYTDYTTVIAEESNMQQSDSFISGPVDNKLILKFIRPEKFLT